MTYEDNGLGFCCRRNYMGLQYLSEHRLCNGCEFEVRDTFVGSESGVEKKLWFCKFIPGEQQCPGQSDQ